MFINLNLKKIINLPSHANIVCNVSANDLKKCYTKVNQFGPIHNMAVLLDPNLNRKFYRKEHNNISVVFSLIFPQCVIYV